MQFTMKVLAMIAVMGLAGVVMAKDVGAPKEGRKKDVNALHGKVVRVDGATVVVATKKDKEKVEVPVVTDKDTKVTIDGVAKTVADLTPGLYVSITPATGVAKDITAKTATAREGDKPKKPANP